MAHISSRSGIRWGSNTNPLTEPTDTIVLTSPEKRFVDVRVLRDAEALPDGTLPPSSLDWAFAGSTTTHSDNNKTTFSHWVDSRTTDAESVVDVGENSVQEDGTTLERGEMTNPATGKVTPYEEVWVEIPVRVVPVLGEETPREKVCVVLQMEGDLDAGCAPTRGVVVRLGQYCQGVVRRREEVLVERLTWDGEQETWVRPVHVRIGGSGLEAPTDFATYFGHEAVVGDEVGVGGYVWRVVERG